jgi:hypothetical protein
MQLIETNTKFDYQILEDIQGKPLRVGGEIQLADVRNANGRVYPLALWSRVMENKKISGRLSERKMLGELDHPESGKTSLSRVSHVMTELKLQPSARFSGKQAVYGVYECLPTPPGKILDALLRSRIGLGISSRGDGDLEERDGASYVMPESYELDTFDVVIDPSVDVAVRVLGESKQTDCSICVPAHPEAAEALANAICGIVESEDYSRDAAVYYQTILEGLDLEEDSKNYSRACEALRILNGEVNTEMKPNASAAPSLTEAQASVIEQSVKEQNERLQRELKETRDALVESEKYGKAGEVLVSECLLRLRAMKMQTETWGEAAAFLPKLEARHQKAKEVIEQLRSSVQNLQTEAKLRMAAEKLLGALLSKIDETKRMSYVDRLLRNESTEVQKRLRPILLKCESKSDVNTSLKAFKEAIRESRNPRGLPPTENGRRSAKISASNPLLESGDKGRDETPAPKGLEESVSFSKMLVKSMRG